MCVRLVISADKVVVVNSSFDRRLVSLVGKVLDYRAGGLGSIPGRTNKIIEGKVLPLP